MKLVRPKFVTASALFMSLGLGPLLSGCEDDGPPSAPPTPPPTVADYFPLHEGATRTYAFYDSLGNARHNESGEPATAVARVLGIHGVSGGAEQFAVEVPNPRLQMSPTGPCALLCIDQSSGIAVDTASVGVSISHEVDEVLSLLISSQPEIQFEAPRFSADSSFVRFRHAQPFLNYHQYTVRVEGSLRVRGRIESTADERSFCIRECPFYPQVDTTLCWVKADSVFDMMPFFFSLEEGDSLAPWARLRLRPPLEVGNQWVSMHPTLVPGSSVVTVEERAEILAKQSMQIHGETYPDVIQVRYDTQTQVTGEWTWEYEITEVWYAPHVGIVRVREGDGKSSMELTDYQP